MGKRIRFISLLSIEVFAIILSVVLFPQTLHAAETFLDLSALCNTAAVPGTGGTTVVIDFDEKVLLDRLGENPVAEYVLIPVKNNVDTAEVNLSGRVLRQLGTRNCRVRIINKASEISFPAAGIDMTSIGQELESHPENVVVRFFISWESRSVDAFVKGIAQANGMNPVTKAVELHAEAAAGDQTTELKDFNGYIETSLELPAEININTAAGVRLDRNGKLLPVPAVFRQGDGKTTAVLKHGASGIYAVVENPGEFIDMQGHWARYDVGVLASKLIVTRGTYRQCRGDQDSGQGLVFWDGTNSAGRPADPGKYKLVIRAADSAGKTAEMRKTVTVYPYLAVVSYEPENEASGVPVDTAVIVQFCDRVQQGPEFNKIALTQARGVLS